LHAILLAAIGSLGVADPFKLVLAVLLLAHAWSRLPQSETRPLVREVDGCWSVPEAGCHRWRLDRSTRHTTLWILVVLRKDHETLRILLLRDQLDPISWHSLLAVLATSRGE
jgi:hypothetical protein